ncbi:DXO/RAI1 family decapping nuclease [Aspergillus stella-maris]|uniref:DXO/RAI1 family decapping nuclease n=1 Tax=Aspergillus stella-maris TaxID=1810926 RepID=UPI003CCDC263
MNRTAFDIQPIGRFYGSSAAIRRPKEIASFSYDDQHAYHLGDSSLRWYYPPQLPADLNRGFDTFQKLDDTADEHLDALLDTIVALERETEKKCEADIITWRGMMTKILTAPFDNMNGFEMNATCFQKQLQKNQRMPPGMASQDLMAYWGYKFETISVLDKTWDDATRDEIEQREDLVVNNNAQYCSIARTGIGHSKLVLGGEVDAIWDSKPDRKEDPINWVELKTSAEIRNDRDKLKFERKLLKFWAQSFLLGVPKIVVGFRDQDGIVRRLEELETAKIPSKVKLSGRGTWDGNICINFAATFLDWLKTTIQESGTYRLKKAEKSSLIEVYKIEESGTGDILSQAFLSWRTKT